jgi:3-hydroxybutyryl-CoA dehydrogenase
MSDARWFWDVDVVFPYLPTTARDFVKRYVHAAKLGRKSGEGFYSDYK